MSSNSMQNKLYVITLGEGVYKIAEYYHFGNSTEFCPLCDAVRSLQKKITNNYINPQLFEIDFDNLTIRKLL